MALSGYGNDPDEHDAFAAAKRAARRAGMSLSEWLDSVVVGAVPDRQPSPPSAAEPKSTEQSIAEIKARLDAFARRHGGTGYDETERRMSGEVMRRIEDKLQALARTSRSTLPLTGETESRQAGSETISVAAIERAISDIASQQRRLEQEFENTMAGHSDRIDHRIEKVAERLERNIEDTSDSTAIRGLEEQLRGLVMRLDRDPTAPAPELNRQLSELVGRLDDLPPRIADELADRLEAAARRLDTATRAEIDSIRGEMREIAQEIDRATRSGFETVAVKLAELSASMNERHASEQNGYGVSLDDEARSHLAAIRNEIGEVASKLDGSRQNDHPALLDEFRELAGRVEAVVPNRMQALERQLESLADRISAAPASAAVPELSGIERRIDSLARHMEAPPAWLHELLGQLDLIAERLGGSGNAASREDLLEIERQINALAERVEARPDWLGDLERKLGEIESTPAPDEGDRRGELEEIERQISLLSERLEGEHSASADLAGLERQISELMRRLDAADHDAGAISALKQDLAALKIVINQANEHNQSTLYALHDTLNRIADRLGDAGHDSNAAMAGPDQSLDEMHWEGELPAPEAPQFAVTDEEQLAPDDIIGRIEAVTRSFKGEEEDHTPLAPGSGPPYNVPPVTEAGEDAEADDNGPPRTGREDFIAAARRAAQAATAETARPEPAGPAARNSAITSQLRAYRRPLIAAGFVTVVIIVALMLAGRVTGFAIGEDSGDASPAVASVPDDLAEDAPAPSPAAPEAGPPIVEQAPSRETMVVTGSTGPADGELPKFQTSYDEALESEADAGPAEQEADRSASKVEMPPEAIGSQRLREAAAAGDPVAQLEVASRFSDGKGVAQDLAKAAYWLRLAGAQGLAPAQYRLGSLYEKGQGVATDIAMARSWYQRAAEQGNRAAMHNLAVLHADGAGNDPDYEQAALWFRQSAEYGLKDSQYNLAILHARGLGVEQSLGESYRWFAAAAEQGDAEAAVQRDEIAQRLDPEELSAAKLAFQSWQAKPLLESANQVSGPEGGWDDPEPAPADGATMIRQAQSLLYQLGYAPGPADGESGPMTERAVIEYQRAAGLAETGEVTPELLEHLAGAAG